MDNDTPRPESTEPSGTFTPSQGGTTGPAGPPLLPPPPPPPSASRKPKRGRGRGWIFLIVGAVALGWALLEYGLDAFGPATHLTGRAGKHGGGWLVETVVEDNHSKHKIAVIEIGGVIADSPIDHSGHTFVDKIKEELDLAAADPKVRAVLLKIDSPGGEVLASDNIYRAIRTFQQKTKKPVVAVMGSLAASGGYYVAAPCRWIVANELTITGSIGVIMYSYNYRGLMDKVGVRPEVYKSGKFKDMMSGDRLEIPAEERAMMQDMINETFQRFKSVVIEGRKWAGDLNEVEGRKLAADWENSADGRIVSGKQAFQIGLVDELGDQEKAIDKALDIAGIPDANLVSYAQQFELGSLFKLFGQSESRALRIDLGFELPKLNAGRLYFLSGHLFNSHETRQPR